MLKKNHQTTKCFSQEKVKHSSQTQKLFFFLKSEENYLYLTIPEKGTMSMFFSVKNKLLNCKIKNDLQS